MNTPLKNCPLCKGTGTTDNKECLCTRLDQADSIRLKIVKVEIFNLQQQQGKGKKFLDLQPGLQKHYRSFKNKII